MRVRVDPKPLPTPRFGIIKKTDGRRRVMNKITVTVVTLGGGSRELPVNKIRIPSLARLPYQLFNRITLADIKALELSIFV